VIFLLGILWRIINDPINPKTLPLRQNIETTKILKKSISANPSTSSGRTGETLNETTVTILFHNGI